MLNDEILIIQKKGFTQVGTKKVGKRLKLKIEIYIFGIKASKALKETSK
jgi:hypothetical protein